MNFIEIFGLLIVLCLRYASTELVEANWEPCKYENGSVIPTQSEDVHIYVTNCTKNEEICQFIRGTNPLLNITFKAKSNSNEIERGILAKMYMSALGKYVNIPYGNLWNPCESMKNLNTSEANCLTSGVQNENIYNSISEFRVNQDFPQVSGITVRIIFRQKNNSRRISSLRKWDKHPGPLYLCIELPNCAVI